MVGEEKEALVGEERGAALVGEEKEALVGEERGEALVGEEKEALAGEERGVALVGEEKGVALVGEEKEAGLVGEERVDVERAEQVVREGVREPVQEREEVPPPVGRVQEGRGWEVMETDFRVAGVTRGTAVRRPWRSWPCAHRWRRRRASVV